MSWRNGTNAPWRARFCATRVTPAHDWRERPLAPEVWLLCERDLGTAPRTQYCLVNLPPTASLRALVRLAHQRWAIEQQYQELKDEMGWITSKDVTAHFFITQPHYLKWMLKLKDVELRI